MNSEPHLAICLSNFRFLGSSQQCDHKRRLTTELALRGFKLMLFAKDLRDRWIGLIVINVNAFGQGLQRLPFVLGWQLDRIACVLPFNLASFAYERRKILSVIPSNERASPYIIP